MRLDELIWKIMIDTGYFQYVGAMPGGKTRQGNLKLLVDRAESMASSNHASLFQFVSMVDKMHKTGSEIGTAKIIGESENVVRIMSIHKSKGLEFPVVFVAGMGKKFNLRDAYQEVLLHKTLGIGPKHVDAVHRVAFDTLPKKLIKRQIRMESLAEEMRVLYVALTRAVDKLILFGTAKNLENHSKKWCRGDGIFNLMNGQSYLDWLMMILSKHPVSQPIWTMAEKSYLGLSTHPTAFSLNIHQREELFREMDHQREGLKTILEDIEEYYDEKTSEVLTRSFEYTYPYRVHTLPSKFSVTELKQLEKGIKTVEPLNRIPKFLAKETKKTPAEIGTLMHFVMQKLDRKRDDIEVQLNDMLNKGILSSDDLTYIQVDALKKFFDSEIGRRYAKATYAYQEKAFVLKKKLEITGEDDILIQGIIDCYFEEEDGIVLIDYKTDYLYGDGKILIEKYRPQLDLYKEAIEKITKKHVKETYIYSFYRNQGFNID